MAQLLVFVRFDDNEEVIEEFFFCKPLESHTTAELIFKVNDEFVLKVGIPWLKCIGLCADGAEAMSGKLTGLAAKMKGVAPECKSTHCVIYREALAAKGMPENLNSVLSDAVKVTNFINARAP
ncbi:zinc finger BED domain-containing protein 5-like [Leptinotarsa decemlineata]|uniref:zinc finger BED domain-containing protein 5-like n=1 Tax=Leptinotarsa decemlineata TaxID=7539 RepID=UPI003D3050B3